MGNASDFLGRLGKRLKFEKRPRPRFDPFYDSRRRIDTYNGCFQKPIFETDQFPEAIHEAELRGYETGLFKQVFYAGDNGMLLLERGSEMDIASIHSRLTRDEAIIYSTHPHHSSHRSVYLEDGDRLHSERRAVFDSIVLLETIQHAASMGFSPGLIRQGTTGHEGKLSLTGDDGQYVARVESIELLRPHYLLLTG